VIPPPWSLQSQGAVLLESLLDGELGGLLDGLLGGLDSLLDDDEQQT
jgi:hypothetical protein